MSSRELFELEPGDTGEALQTVHPCGHATREKGCGGCDPGAIEFIRDDGGPWRRVHSDRDGSEEPYGSRGEAEKVNGWGAYLEPPALDLDAICKEWLSQCGACDFGMHGCSCPDGDYRPVMSLLVDEIERLRALP